MTKFIAPDDLTEYDQWVLWRLEKQQRSTPTKIRPYQLNGKREGRHDRPSDMDEF